MYSFTIVCSGLAKSVGQQKVDVIRSLLDSSDRKYHPVLCCADGDGDGDLWMPDKRYRTRSRSLFEVDCPRPLGGRAMG